MEPDRWRQWVLWSTATLAVAAVLWLAHVAQAIFVPCLLAFYLVLMLLPLHRWLQGRLHRRLRWLATLLTSLVPLVVLALVGLLAWWITDRLMEEGPKWEGEVVATWHTARAWLAGFGVPVERMFDDEAVGQLAQPLLQPVGGALLAALDAFLGGILILFIVILTLIERPVWRRKAHVLFMRGSGSEVVDVLRESAVKLRIFFFWRTVTGILSGAIVAALTWGLGVGLVPLWFLLQWVSNYVPTIGAVVAGVLPALFALVTVGWKTALWVGLGITATEQIVGTLVGPRLQGRGLALSPAAVLVALLVFGWIWGIVGALLSAPILATLHSIARRVPELVPLAILIGGDPADDPALTPRGPAL